MTVILRGIDGPLAGCTFELKKGDRLVIGRDPHVAISVADAELSRRHCEISWDGTTCRIADLRSTNGTTVNGNAVISAGLGNGDRIQAGRSLISVEIIELQLAHNISRQEAEAPRP